MTGGVTQSQDVMWLFTYASILMSSPTSHPICASWYLPIFLFRDWSLTLMRMASLRDQAMFWSSVHSTNIVNRCVMTSGVVMVMDGWMGLHVFFEPFCKCSAWLSYIFFLTVHPATFLSIHHPTFLKGGISPWGLLGGFLTVLPPLKHLNAMFTVDVFAAST